MVGCLQSCQGVTTRHKATHRLDSLLVLQLPSEGGASTACCNPVKCNKTLKAYIKARATQAPQDT